MKNYLSTLVICFLLLSSLGAVVSGNYLNSNTYSNPIERIIVPISYPSSEFIYIENINNEEINELKSVSDDLDKSISKNHFKNNFESYNFVIITTEDLSSAITSSNFVDWKTSIGYNITIVYITDDEIADQEGQDLPEKIRNFLREYYTLWEIKYVMIVGDHQTIPMRYCYPDPSNHYNGSGNPGSGGEVPTDYYYADLTSSDSESWDSDGDGYYGEYGDDTPNFEAEVYVGRIPTSISSRVTYTLNKIVSFENDNGNWKNAALHAGAFYYLTNEDNSGHPAMDAARCMYEIENDFMDGWDIAHFSEQEGLEKSIYDWDTLNYNKFSDAWRKGTFAVVNWGSHAYMDCAARKVWSGDDGDGVPESHEISWPRFIDVNSNLDDDYPSIVFAMGCLIGCPEPYQYGNLGIDLLTEPNFGSSVGIISSTRTPYGTWNWPTDPGGCESYCYKFNQYIINESQAIGDALFDSKYYCHINYGWDSWHEYMNLYIFNLYGDPSLIREGISSNHPPSTPEISGETNGQIGKYYDYTFVSTDDDNDNLTYEIDWGDGTNETTGVFPSGIVVNASHKWNKKDTYIIGIRAKDEYSYSGWGTLTVTMPKAKSLFFNFHLLSWLLERFTFPLFRYILKI